MFVELRAVIHIYADKLLQRVGDVRIIPRFDPQVVFHVGIIELGKKIEALEHLFLR